MGFGAALTLSGPPACLACLKFGDVSGAIAPSRDRRWNCCNPPGLHLGGWEECQAERSDCKADLMWVRVCSATLGAEAGGVSPSHPERLPMRVFEPEGWARRGLPVQRFGWVGRSSA